jgi:DNA polymerase-3 subunit epsilon
VTAEQLWEYPSRMLAFAELTQTLGRHCNKYDKADKFHLVGYNNAGFDNAFLRDWWADSYFGSFFWADTIDVMVLASQACLHYRPTMPNFKLATVCAHFGVQADPDRLHDAAYDVDLTRQLYAKLTGI